MQEEYAIRRYEQAAALLPMRWQRLARQLLSPIHISEPTRR